MSEINDLNVTDNNNTARFPEGMNPSQVNDSARALEGIIARWHKDINGSVAVAGTDTYTAGINKDAGFALYDGFMFCGDFANANTGAATLNLTPDAGSALGAKDIIKPDGTALAAGDINAGQKVLMVYNGTSFQLIGASGGIQDGSITTAKIADGAVTAAKIDPSVELGGPSLGSRSVMRVNEQNIREDITVWENRSTNVTIDTGADTINKGSDDGWANGDHISFDATTLPTGISVATIYYVVGVTANTLQVSTTYGGSALNFTDTGTSVNIYKPINTSTVGDITIESGFTVDVPAGSTWVVI